jgi:hypothetical protein
MIMVGNAHPTWTFSQKIGNLTPSFGLLGIGFNLKKTQVGGVC